MLRDLIKVFLAGALVFYLGARLSEQSISTTFARGDTLDDRPLIVARDLGTLLTLVVDIETGVRGYVITGDRSYLEPYHNAVKRFGPVMAEIAQSSTAPQSQQRLEELRQSIDGLIKSMAEPAIAARSGMARADTDTLIRGGKGQVDRARRLVDSLVRAEAEYVKQQRQVLEGQRQKMRVLVGLGFAVTGLLTVLTLYLMTRRHKAAVGRLALASQRLARGEFDQPIGDERHELGHLANSLRTAAEGLAAHRAQTNALLVSNRLLSLQPTVAGALTEMTEALRPALAVVEMAILPVNDALRALTGPMGLAIQTGKPSFLGPLDQVPDEPIFHTAPAGGWALVPMVIDDEVDAILAMSLEVWSPVDDGQFLERLAVMLSIALERSKLFLSLEERNRLLLEAGRTKSDFLALMSHELRTPLNSVLGFSEVLADRRFGEMNERQLRYLNNIHSSGRYLLGLINDLLDLSKIEAGRLDVARRQCWLNDAVNEAVSSLAGLAQERGVTLIRPPTKVPVVTADPLRIKQVLYNLLSNAIKFSPEKSTVTIVWTPQDDGRVVRLAIADQGPGISDSDKERLFQPFQQVGGPAQTGTLGTGLGLSLSRRLIELMRGKIGLESKLGKGSTFWFELPRSGGTTSEVPAVPPANADVALIIDDDAGSQELLEIELRGVGFTPMRAATGEEGLAMANLLGPKLIVLDIALPGMDGWAVLRELRRLPVTANVPTVIVSVQADSSGHAEDAGALGHLVKPLGRGELAAFLAQHKITVQRPTVAFPPLEPARRADGQHPDS